MAEFDYYVGKDRLQVQTGRDRNGRAMVEYREPGEPLPEAAEWDTVDRYIDLGLVIRVPRMSDDEVLAEVERRGLLKEPAKPKSDAKPKTPRVRRRRRKKAADQGQSQPAGDEDSGDRATGKGGADAAPPAPAPPAEFPKAAGGGMYELSNGERVRGKQKAAAAEEALANAA